VIRLVVEGGPYVGVSRADVVRRLRAMLDVLSLEDSEVSIVLTGDAQIQKLNREFRKKNRPTDVLAFALREGEHTQHAGQLLGDIVVSIPTARRQATAGGRSLGPELTMLLAHGLLHLLGWDHDTPNKDRRMRRETDRLCAAADAAATARGARASRAKGLTKGRLRDAPMPIRSHEGAAGRRRKD
jgi:probable rRNA maturation factor